MLRTPALLFALTLLAAQVWAAPQSAESEIVRLADGTLLHGEILEFDEATGILLKRVDNGGTLQLRWEHLPLAEVKRLKASRGFLGEEPEPWLVSVARLVLANGTTELGVLVEDGRSDVFTLRRRHGTDSFPRQYVRAVESAKVDGLAVYSPADLYQLIVAERGVPASAEQHFDLAVVCEGASLHAQALEHYTAAQQLDAAYRRELIATRLQRAKVRVENVAETAQLDGIRNRLYKKQFDEALEAVAAFRTQYPTSSQLGDLAQLEADIGRERLRHYAEKAVPDYYSFLGKSLFEIARNPQMTIDAAQELLETSVHEEIVARLASNYRMSPQGVEELWRERRGGSVRTAGYGSGTFILGAAKALRLLGPDAESKAGAAESSEAVDPDDLQARIEEVLKKRQQEAAARAEASQAAKALKGGLSPDQWWEQATFDDRQRWLTAWYAEFSGHLEALRAKFNDCRICNGLGTIQGVNEKNEVVTVACSTCKGLKSERLVNFR
ncbi:MAG: hypothetical protein ACT4PU_13585 [Planctomycetota bacterium]